MECKNGIDCGPIATALVVVLRAQGITYNTHPKVQLPQLECAHTTRERMLHDLSDGVLNNYHLWMALTRKGEKYIQEPSDHIIQILDDGPDKYYRMTHIERSLANELLNCVACKSRRIPPGQNDDSLIAEEDEPQPSSSDEDQPLRSSDSEGDMQHPVSMPSHLRKEFSMMKAARCRPSKKAKAPKATPKLVTLEPKRFQIFRRNRHKPFDDYHNGPSLEDMRMFAQMGGLESQPLDWFSKPTVRSVWELFRDWGYRLEPEFALMFACETPQKVIEHILPLPTAPNIKKEGEEEEEEEGPDVCVMGMSEMIEYAGGEGSTDSMNLFVKGHTFDGRQVKFDPSRDRSPVSQWTLSSDIDSIIVTGRELKVLGDVDIQVLPYSGRTPPISKSNHTYVELLMPQSEDDLHSGGRDEWFSTRHSVSTIPHTHFGKIGLFNISIHFPRMKHKDPVTGRTATLIPWEVQNLFLVEVLYPAILAGENPSTMPYKNYTLDEWKWKAANHARFSGANRTVVLTAEQFHAMQRAMMDIIASDPDDLGIFGSYYLLMEAKGIKQHTNCVIGENDLNPYEVLCQKVPYLDFEHYKKRENGQMVMDLGFGFHPTGVDNTPLVCLWDLAKVAQSYGAAGMQKGTIHHTNTMAGYGGRQSEMTQVRSSLVQICFRSTYGLHYEPVRRVRGGEISFCEDIDAYDTNAAFMKSCEDYIKMLNGGRSKSFGARDEVRGSGAAICEVLESLPSIVSPLVYPFTRDCQFIFEHKMKEYLKKSPFICIPSNTYFTFTRRRLRECQNVLLDLARYRPSNFGISVAILMHMIRYVCHSPDVKNKPYLQDALRDVRFQEVMSDWGMFFLHDLDLEHHCILEIVASDPDKCRAAMSRDGKVPKILPTPQPPSSTPSGLYPLGDAPAWSEVKAFIGKGAQELMHRWVWDPKWGEEDAAAARLFTRFTREFFATLKIDVLRADSPSPICLEDAMELWSVKGLSTTLVSCCFTASNHGLQGKFPGARNISFKDHTQTFFPINTTHYGDSAWAPFLHHGYIRDYRQTMEELDDEEGLALQEAISVIFGRLHCLPVVVAPSQKSKGRIWTSSHQGVLFITNPIFYKLKRVGSAKASARVSKARLQRVKASDAVINKRFLDMNGDGSSTAAQGKQIRKLARDRMKRLSDKRKRKRQPPKRWAKKVLSPPESCDEEEDEENEVDDLEEEEEEEEIDELEEEEVDELLEEDNVEDNEEEYLDD